MQAIVQGVLLLLLLKTLSLTATAADQVSEMPNWPRVVLSPACP